MKSKLHQTLAVIFFLLISLAVAPAQPTPSRPPAVNPVTGLPVPGGAPAIDPTTGLPVAPPAPAAPTWIDPNWNDPDLVLTNVAYDSIALKLVASDLRERFKDHFDILPTPDVFGTDWGGVEIELQMKNVRASEVFNAMNLIFENERRPLRWELKVNSNGRQFAMLRVLPEAAPQPEPPAARPPETHRMVYFVGNLLGDEKSGGMTMEQIVKTITDIWPAEFGKPEGVIQFHKDAQLLVVNGTQHQLEFIHQTLAALELKAQLERNKRIEADMKSKMLPPPPKIMPGGDAKQ